MAKKITFREDRLTQGLVRECFDYHEDGHLIWKDRPDYHFATPTGKKIYTTQRVGKVAGRWHKRTDRTKVGFGYWITNLTIAGELGAFKIHRLIWMYHHGYFPDVIDHIDNDTNNNCIDNLRASTGKTNIFNSYKPKDNTSGFKGVSTLTKKGCFRAEITYHDAWFRIGEYKDPEVAGAAYNKVARILFKEFALFNETDLTDEDVPTNKFFMETYPKLKEGTFDWSSKRRRRGVKFREEL